jgi:hypothetical protein
LWTRRYVAASCIDMSGALTASSHTPESTRNFCSFQQNGTGPET